MVMDRRNHKCLGWDEKDIRIYPRGLRVGGAVLMQSVFRRLCEEGVIISIFPRLVITALSSGQRSMRR